MKVDLSNVFNSGSREAVLRQATQRLPTAMPLITQAYAQPTPLYTAGNIIWSCRSVQQGDPLRPLLFALAIDPVVQSLHSPLNVLYLDKESLVGPADTVEADITALLSVLQSIGLMLNEQKSEIVELGDASLLKNPESSLTLDASTVEAERPHHGISNTFGNADGTEAANRDAIPKANPKVTTPP